MTGRKTAPMRTCVGCGRKTEKDLLFRIVRTPDGRILPDPDRRVGGRSAYVCRNAACLDLAAKRNGLSRSFREKTDPSALEALRTLLEASFSAADDGTPERRDHG